MKIFLQTGSTNFYNKKHANYASNVPKLNNCNENKHSHSAENRINFYYPPSFFGAEKTEKDLPIPATRDELDALKKMSEKEYEKYKECALELNTYINLLDIIKVSNFKEPDARKSIIYCIKSSSPMGRDNILEHIDVFNNKKLIPHLMESIHNNWRIVNANSYQLNTVNTETGTNFLVESNGEDIAYYVKYKSNDANNTTTKILLVTQDGLYYRKQEPNECYKDMHNKFIKLTEKLESLSLSYIENFLSKDTFSGELVFYTNSPHSPGHAQINLGEKRNSIFNINNSNFSIMGNFQEGFSPERIVYHYPDGRVSITDFLVNIIATLKPNNDKTGMILRKFVGDKEIYLSSKVVNNNIKLKNKQSGKSCIIPISFFSDNSEHYSWEKLNYITEEEREEKMIELMKKLSPTTILDLINLKLKYPNVNFQFLKSDASAHYISGKRLSLKDNIQSVSHEALHSVTEIEDLTKPLHWLHLSETIKNKGLIWFLSQYATNGYQNNYDRGLDELIAIIGTANIYGQENGSRTEAARIAFPKTISAAEQYLINHYIKLISEIIEN